MPTFRDSLESVAMGLLVPVLSSPLVGLCIRGAHGLLVMCTSLLLPWALAM